MTTKITWNGKHVDTEEAVKLLADFLRSGRGVHSIEFKSDEPTRYSAYQPKPS